MQSLAWTTVVALALTTSASASPLRRQDEACATVTQRMPWEMLTADEKSAYIDAELCLQATPPVGGIEGTQNVWDELQHVHIRQSDFIHGVGAFLAWHRGYVKLHSDILAEHCGYTGPIPYWDEAVFAREAIGLADQPIFQPDAFGGDGVANSTTTNSTATTTTTLKTRQEGPPGGGFPGGPGEQNCIADGPFANITLHFETGGSTGSYCLYRSFRSDNFIAQARGIDDCWAAATFEDAWNCIEGNPHAAGHGGTGGVMVGIQISPGDPVFWLHHGYIDAVFWRWQSLDLVARLTDIGGLNVPRRYTGDSSPFTDYDGDEGNVTTLNHNLWYEPLGPNRTVGDLMDLSSPWNCATYVYTDEI